MLKVQVVNRSSFWWRGGLISFKICLKCLAKDRIKEKQKLDKRHSINFKVIVLTTIYFKTIMSIFTLNHDHINFPAKIRNKSKTVTKHILEIRNF